MLKILLPTELAQLSTLQLHVLSPSALRISLNLALDSRIESTEDTSSQEGSIDAVVDADGGDRYTCETCCQLGCNVTWYMICRKECVRPSSYVHVCMHVATVHVKEDGNRI